MRYFIITGTSRGIGKGLVDYFLKDKNTMVTGISRTQVQRPSEQYSHFAFDLSDLDRLEQEASGFFPSRENGDEVVLINNAGLLGDVGPLGSIIMDNFRKVMDVNVSAAAILMNAFIAQYAALDAKKVIVNISSGAGKSPVDGWSAYCTSKAAIDMLSRVAAEECALHGNGIRVFSIAPGVVDTDMQGEIRKVDKAQFSNIQRFLDLKANGDLSESAAVAEKLARVVENPEKFEDVLLDVRNPAFGS